MAEAIAPNRVLTAAERHLVHSACCASRWFLWLLFSQDNRHAAACVARGHWWVRPIGSMAGWARRYNQVVSELGKVHRPGHRPMRLMLHRRGAVAIAHRRLGAVVVRDPDPRPRSARRWSLRWCSVRWAARRIDVTWWGKTGTFALLMFAYPFFLAESRQHLLGRHRRGCSPGSLASRAW